MTLYLGIDIGGTKTAAGLVTTAGQVVESAQRATPAQEGGLQVLASALDLAQQLCAQAGQPVRGIGIGAGGQIDSEHGIVLSATDLLPGWRGIDLRTAFEETLAIPTSVDNDVNALAAGEARFGAARGMKTTVFLALGTGVGGALLLDGRVHHGAHWSGGEFGHILLSIAADARRDSGGGCGSLEAYAGGPGLVQTWRELSGETATRLTGEEIGERAARDPQSVEAAAIRRTGEYLGFGLVTLANALDPDLIVIGGGLAALGDALLSPARQVLRDRALPGPAACPVVTAALGRKASLIGAATLAMPHNAGEPPSGE